MPIPVSTDYTSPLTTATMIAYCGWDPTTPVTDGQTLLDGNASMSIFLPCLHVTGVSAITVTGWDGFTYPAKIGVGLDANWRASGELTWLPTALNWRWWPQGDQNVTVTYSGGYETIPADLAAALASLDARMPRVQSGLTTAKIGTASMTYAAQVAAGGLLLVEQMVFDKYKIPRVR